jgi:ubiquinone/menaquinone biosynthesis C-methylase UbiE
MSVDQAARDQTRNVYTTVAANYAELLTDTRYEAAVDLAMVQHFLGQEGVGHGAEVLDAGCGAGRMLSHLEQLDPSLRLTGMDLAPGMVHRARLRHPHLQIVEGDLVALPFEDERFEGVLSWYSIIHLPKAELPSVFSECRRVLRPGGSLLLGFHAGSGERAVHHAYGHDVDFVVQLHDVQLVSEALVAGGFALVARLERAARGLEKNAQGFVLATRV